MPTAAGSFDITSRPEPPFFTKDGVLLGRMEFDKVFQGQLRATSVVYMTYARTPIASSAGYVAVELVTGELEGRSGSFVMLHHGITEARGQSLTLTIVPDSGTGELAGVKGSMVIDTSGGGHAYVLDYEFGR